MTADTSSPLNQSSSQVCSGALSLSSDAVRCLRFCGRRLFPVMDTQSQCPGRLRRLEMPANTYRFGNARPIDLNRGDRTSPVIASRQGSQKLFVIQVHVLDSLASSLQLSLNALPEP